MTGPGASRGLVPEALASAVRVTFAHASRDAAAAVTKAVTLKASVRRFIVYSGLGYLADREPLTARMNGWSGVLAATAIHLQKAVPGAPPAGLS